MPLPTVQGLVSFGNLAASASIQQTVAGIARSTVNFFNFSVPPPITAYASATFLPFYTNNKVPYSQSNFFIITPKIVAVQTPGFIAAISLNWQVSIQAALVSPSVLSQGLILNHQYGLPVFLQGPPTGIQLPNPSLGLAALIAASGNTISPVIPSYYYPHIVIGLTSSQNGAVNVQRYVDTLGVTTQGSALTAALTGGSPAVLDNADGKGFGSFTIQITNTGAATATVTAVTALLLAR
jgi:hypothetical protein